jgi:hypothetical protein
MLEPEEAERIAKIEAEAQHFKDWFESENEIQKAHNSRMYKKLEEHDTVLTGKGDKAGILEVTRNIKRQLKFYGIAILAVTTGSELGLKDVILSLF